MSKMFKITVYTDQYKFETFVNSNEEALKLRTKVQSQMNNGHTVVVGQGLFNPNHIQFIRFEEVGEEDYE